MAGHQVGLGEGGGQDSGAFVGGDQVDGQVAGIAAYQLLGAEMTVANVVRLNIYTTDVGELLQQFGVLAERFADTPDRFASTVLGVASLAGPDLLVALEATAMD
ncbi:hypothetical protein [Kribbella sp. NBC_00889]|uniref:hypothetical protein n=1 Tax=Kribbella sp. NBC_00889 TaxID=2975974 RepID=UPI00386C8877|nr:RidA family protein [Kribbella sp. NBC_00889]